MGLVRRFSWILGYFVALQLFGCATYSPVSKNQVALDAKDPLECAYLGEISASGNSPENSLNMLESETLKKGGNHLVVTESLRVAVARLMRGTVYRCPQ